MRARQRCLSLFKTRKKKKAMKYPFPVPSPNPNPNCNTISPNHYTTTVASEAYHDWSGEAAGARLHVNFTLKLLLSQILQNFCNRPLMRFISFASNIGLAAAVPAGPAPASLHEQLRKTMHAIPPNVYRACESVGVTQKSAYEPVGVTQKRACEPVGVTQETHDHNYFRTQSAVNKVHPRLNC